MTPETRSGYYRQRSRVLNKATKAALVDTYRKLGGLGGVHPPEQWRKDELVSSIVDMEWDRRPEEMKLPERPLFDPPCQQCGHGPDHGDHQHGGDHNYHYTSGESPEHEWLCRRCETTPAAHDGHYCPGMKRPQAPNTPTCTAPGCGKTDPEHNGWRQGHRFRVVMEVQPLAADATMTRIDVQAPYCYVLHRMDQDPPRVLSWGAWETAPEPMSEAYHAATNEVSRVRIEHKYYGPMRVQVWQRREDEHYAREAPQDAYTLYVGDMNNLMWVDYTERLVKAETPTRHVDGPGCHPVSVPARRCPAGHLWDEECEECP